MNSGKLFLIGCGPGDSDLLTLKALKTIQKLDIALIDHLLTQEIIDLIPSSTKVVFVGKEKGRHSVTQERINAMIVEYAKQGFCVGRLKCGDPYIFGRGTEEAICAFQHGIETEVIPGISSALSAPMAAGIAPTSRGLSTGLSIVSAHFKGNRINLEWIPLLGYQKHTTVVLMGLSRAEQITEAALELGINPDMPVAIISNATSSEQNAVYTTLSKLPECAKNAPRPGLLVFGDVVNLSNILPIYNYEPKEASHDIAYAG